MSGEPICSGMMKFAKPYAAGGANRNIMIVPWIVNSWLYCSGLDDLQARLRQLGADEHGHQAGGQEEPERRAQVEQADRLVVRRREDLGDLGAGARARAAGPGPARWRRREGS